METFLYVAGLLMVSGVFVALLLLLIPLSITQWAKARRDYELLRAEVTNIQELRDRLAAAIADAAITRIERRSDTRS